MNANLKGQCLPKNDIYYFPSGLYCVPLSQIIQSMKVVFFSSKPYDKSYFNAHNKVHLLEFQEAALSESTVGLVPEESAICVFVNDQINATVIEALAQKKTKLIALRCAGFNNVDLAAAQKHQIPVVRVPAYSPHAVAEHAVALLLTLNRKTHKAYNRVREGNFSLQGLEGFDLYQKTVGVVGVGKIGKIFIQIMRGFGCHIKVYDIVQDPELLSQSIAYVSLEQLLKESDIISLHCPLNKDTQYLINKQSLSLMKDQVYLINTGRGGLINTKDAIVALKSGKLGGLALDVYEQESNLFFSDHSADIIQDDILQRLSTFPNVIITSHQGFFTKEALTQIAQITFQNISDLENSNNCVNRVI